MKLIIDGVEIDTTKIKIKRRPCFDKGEYTKIDYTTKEEEKCQT